MPHKLERLGIPLGAYGEPTAPTITSLNQRGVSASRNSVSRIRNGFNSGEKTSARILSGDLLRYGTVEKKDLFFLRVAQEGVAIRSQQTEPNSHRFSSERYTEDLAASLEMNPQDLRKALRAARADLIYAEHQDPQAKLIRFFIATAERYLKDYVEIRGTRSSAKTQIDRFASDWNHATIKDFYNKQDALGHRTAATWTPYEMEVLEHYYRQRIQNGSQLSLQDLLALEAYIKKLPITQVVKWVADQTGKQINGETATLYRNILLFGQTRNPSLSLPEE